VIWQGFKIQYDNILLETDSAMNKEVVIYSLFAWMLLASCSERNASKESIEAQDEMSGELHENDTITVKRDGTLLEGTMDQMDSVPLPSPVINSIEQDSSLTAEAIVNTRKYTENNQTYYEVKFSTENGQVKTVIFDDNGKIKPGN
jgi:hypothetical protein